MKKKTDNKFQILSLDGGGIKGLFSAAVLAAIEDDLKVNLVDHFDLIAGTSTGGIVALGLGLGLKPREIVEFYASKGPAIFSNRLGLKRVSHWAMRKYSARSLAQALQECFGSKLLGDSTKRLVITSYNLGEDDVYLFRTPHHSKLRRDYKVPAWQVALATSAAPTYFPTCRHIDGLRLIDGGVWANNPIMVGVVEAVGTLEVPLKEISVLSVGTSQSVVRRPRRLDSGGIVAWARGAVSVDIIMRGQSIGAGNQASFLLSKERIVRLNPEVGEDEFSIDRAGDAVGLVAMAAHHSRAAMPLIDETFIDHKATQYTPIYP